MSAYLLKTEPGEYSFADLLRDGSIAWAGVSNPQACITLRAMRAGDLAWIYHTGNEKAVVGVARVVSKAAYADPSSNDARTAKGEIARPVIDIEPVVPVETPVTLATIKDDARFGDCALLRQSRLSVMPLSDAHHEALLALTGVKVPRPRAR